jgi:single-stranded DNA-binding protein
MARGINRVIVSGNVSDSARYHETSTGSKCATFRLASDRRGARSGEVVTAWVKINIYNEPLVDICKTRLIKGVYVIVEGELMNREGAQGEVTEIRAKEIIFTDRGD